MKIGIVGSGDVGQSLASGLIELGHEVMIGTREPTRKELVKFKKELGKRMHLGTTTEAASFADVCFLAIAWNAGEDVIAMIRPQLAGKIVIDVTNPLDFSKGMPPQLLEEYSGSTSLGEEIQKALPGAKVVKAFNTVNCNVMVNPNLINNGDHTLFICGNDTDAKNKAKHFLVDTFDWMPENLLDLGGIQSARGVEAYVPFWVMIMQATGSPMFNIKVVK